jgi:NAD(P)H-dependent FMN reductase
MDDKLYIPIILGTTREGRESEKVARFIFKSAGRREDIETELFDVRDFRLPQDKYGQAIKDEFPKWRDAIIRADGLIVVTPEYNRGYPGPLKSVLDLLLKEYNHKAAGIVSVSAGAFGGARGVPTLLPVLRELGLVSISFDLNFARVKEVFDEQGSPKDEGYVTRIDKFLDELAWLARTLKQGREKQTP